MIFNRPHGDYALIRRLAVSGMSDVFLARKIEGDGHLYVLKCLHKHLEEEPSVLRQFYAEASIGERFNSEYLVRVLDARVMAERHTMVMKYMHGVTADSLVDTTTGASLLSVAQAVDICRQSALGLHAAHEMTKEDGQALEIVHRDISPDNILVGFDGSVRVIDFGIARSNLNPEKYLKEAGKRRYMAPEMCQGKAYDQRADVYALGLVLYELLTGIPLYKRETEALTLLAVVDEDAPEFQLECDNQDVRQLIQDAIARDVEQRIPSAQVFEDRATDILEDIDEPVELPALLAAEFEEEKSDLDEQISKSLRAPNPSKETLTLERSIDTPPQPITSEHYQVGEEGIKTSIVRLEDSDRDDESPPHEKHHFQRPIVLIALAALLSATAWLYINSNILNNDHISAEHTVSVETEPPGATLHLEGKVLEGNTPMDIVFKPENEPKLVVQKEGYKTVVRHLSSSTNGLIVFELIPDPGVTNAALGKVKISYSPPDAQLTIDGNYYPGISPQLIEELTIGEEHVLVLGHPGYESLFFPFTLTSADTHAFALQLVDGGPLGEVQITSTPKGGRVYINGQRVGQTPLPSLQLPAGKKYAISIYHAGYSPWRKEIKLAEERREIHAKLGRGSKEQTEQTPAQFSRSPGTNRSSTEQEPSNYPYELIRD